jgi:hypothetical protein
LSQDCENITFDLAVAQKQLRQLQKENEELKAAKQNVPVVNLGELTDDHRAFLVRSCVSGSAPMPAKRARASSDAQSSWEIVSNVSGASTAKQASLSIFNDFSEMDGKVYKVLSELFVKNRWNIVKGEGMYTRGTRPINLEEAIAEFGGPFHVEKRLMCHDKSGECLKHYLELKERPERRQIGPPFLWPRTDRTRTDKAVEDRKVLMFTEVTRLVNGHLGEMGDGPPHNKRLSEFLHETFLMLTQLANAPVTEPCHNLSPEQRNTYLTKLLPEWTWQNTKDVVLSLWYEVKELPWMSRMLLNEEQEFLSAMIEKDTNA